MSAPEETAVEVLPGAVLSYPDAFARLAEIDAGFQALHDERDRIFAAMRANGLTRARQALAAAGFATGVSIIARARWPKQVVGVLLKIGLSYGAPCRPGDTWHFEVRYRSVLKSGRMGKRLDYIGVSVPEPEDLPAHLVIVGTTTREKSLQHPRIIRLSSLRGQKGNHP